MKRICLLYTSAGAGHKMAAKALYEELRQRRGVSVEMVDYAKEYDLPGFNNTEHSYKLTLKFLSPLYGVIVSVIDTAPVTWLIQKAYERQARKYYASFLEEHPADVYLSTSYFDNSLFGYLRQESPKSNLILLVTDLSYPLRIWFAKKADLTILPTREIYRNGEKYFRGFQKKVKVMGLPIAPDFYEPVKTQKNKRALGLGPGKTILLFGGGEGMAQLEEIALELDRTLKHVNICVLCGKDKALKQKLESYSFSNKFTILGWTDKFAKYLLASDLVITKAGATVTWEALVAQKPIIFFNFIRGQETGNYEFASKNGQAFLEKDVIRIGHLAKKLLSKELRYKNSVQIQTNWTRAIGDQLLSS